MDTHSCTFSIQLTNTSWHFLQYLTTRSALYIFLIFMWFYWKHEKLQYCYSSSKAVSLFVFLLLSEIKDFISLLVLFLNVNAA